MIGGPPIHFAIPWPSMSEWMTAPSGPFTNSFSGTLHDGRRALTSSSRASVPCPHSPVKGLTACPAEDPGAGRPAGGERRACPAVAPRAERQAGGERRLASPTRVSPVGESPGERWTPKRRQRCPSAGAFDAQRFHGDLRTRRRVDHRVLPGDPGSDTATSTSRTACGRRRRDSRRPNSTTTRAPVGAGSCAESRDGRDHAKAGMKQAVT